MSVEEIPMCALKMEKEHPACGRPMFRIGVAGGANGVTWAWVCEECDRVSRDNSLDDSMAA